MNKEMIISSTSHETRVAILEDDQVVEVFIEREHSRGVVGNIYKGRVSKVLPGMQSAFVDLGLERDAFLYVTDVISPTEESLEDDDDTVAVGGRAARDGRGRAERRSDADPTASDAAEAGGCRRRGRPQRPTAAARRRASGPAGAPRDRERTPPTAKIEDLLKEGQEVVVQVVKEPLGTKGARITSHLSLPGRFLVYMPTVDHIGVSRKIESRDERRRLRGIVQRFREQSGLPGGVIIRTAASNRSEEDIARRPDLLPAGLDRGAAPARVRAHAGRAVPRGEPRHQAAARSADRAVHGHPHRRRRGVPAGDGVRAAASCRTWSAA